MVGFTVRIRKALSAEVCGTIAGDQVTQTHRTQETTPAFQLWPKSALALAADSCKLPGHGESPHPVLSNSFLWTILSLRLVGFFAVRLAG